MPKVIYRTDDGSEFDSHQEARDHEESMFREWLNACPLVDIKGLVEQLPDDDPEEFYGTPRAFAVDVARAAFERQHD